MDDQTLALLEDLRADLRDLGWTLSRADSRPAKTAPWCRAVYVRPFVTGLDPKPLTAALYDRPSRHRIVRVSTHTDRSRSWEDARRETIRRMREGDAKRRGMLPVALY